MNDDEPPALHCARLALGHYQHNRIPVPESLRRYVVQLWRSADGTESAVAQSKSDNDFIDSAEAAHILGCSREYIRRIHTDLDGQWIAGRWIFNRRAVTEYAAARLQP